MPWNTVAYRALPLARCTVDTKPGLEVSQDGRIGLRLKVVIPGLGRLGGSTNFGGVESVDSSSSSSADSTAVASVDSSGTESGDSIAVRSADPVRALRALSRSTTSPPESAFISASRCSKNS